MLINLTIEIETILIYLIVFLSLALLVVSCFDVNYFFTAAFVYWLCKIRHQKSDIDDIVNYYGLCTTNDLDFYISHMNNARYLRELDFVRLNFYLRTGIYETLIESRATVLQAACTVRYRRPIPFLSAYKVTTKIIYYDDKGIYLEHQFITLRDGFVRTVVISNQRVIGINFMETLNEMLGRDESYQPKLPPELEDWMNMNFKSSNKLKKED